MFGKRNRYKGMRYFDIKQVGDELLRLKNTNLNASYEAADELVNYLEDANNLEKVYSQLSSYAFKVGDRVVDKGLYNNYLKASWDSSIESIIMNSNVGTIISVNKNSLFDASDIARHLQYESWTTLAEHVFVYDVEKKPNALGSKITSTIGYTLKKVGS